MTAAPGDWIDEIAARSGVRRDVVARVLAANGVEEDSTLPRKRSLTIARILLRGTKHGSTDPFEFHWDGLGGGIWGLLTDGNGKGKSSILGLVRGALRGDLPGSRLKPDVWGWLAGFELDFTLDASAYGIRLEKPAGAIDEASATATLTRRDGGRELVIKRAAPGPEFGAAVDSMFMDELGFSRVRAYRAKEGEAVEHGWPAMCASLFITGPGDTLFGDVSKDAVHLRLIQLFMGLPWVTTYTCATTALKIVGAKLAKATSAGGERVAARVAELRSRIETLRRELAEEPDLAAARAALPILDRELVEARRGAEDAATVAAAREGEAADARAARTEARRRLLRARDDAEARLVFRRLKPSCCPACASSIGEGRFAATDAEACGLCGRLEAPSEDAADPIAAFELEAADTLEAQVAAAEVAQAAGRAARAAEDAVAAVRDRIDRAQEDLRKGSAAAALELEIATLRARIEELELPLAPTADVDAIRQEAKVLEAAERVTRGRFAEMQNAIMGDVSRALMGYAVAFGVPNLRSMSLNGAGQLRIEQGGQATSFTKLNAGERLRVKIAAALAVLEVAERRGHGRHPGLIVLDSPAATDMSDQDFAALLESVVAVADRFPDVQILVGAVNRLGLLDRIPPERRRHVEGDDPLF